MTLDTCVTLIVLHRHAFAVGGSGLVERLLMVVVHAAIWRAVFSVPLPVAVILGAVALAVLLGLRRLRRVDR